jgi:hypothetical protein
MPSVLIDTIGAQCYKNHHEYQSFHIQAVPACSDGVMAEPVAVGRLYQLPYP